MTEGKCYAEGRQMGIFSRIAGCIEAMFTEHSIKKGELTVTHQGHAEIHMDFKPRTMNAFFSDEAPSLPSCTPHHEDTVCTSIHHWGHHKWMMLIKWNVASKRTVKWMAKR